MTAPLKDIDEQRLCELLDQYVALLQTGDVGGNEPSQRTVEQPGSYGGLQARELGHGSLQKCGDALLLRRRNYVQLSVPNVSKRPDFMRFGSARALALFITGSSA